MKPKLFIAAAVVSVIVATPFASALTKSSDLLNTERSKSSTMQLQLKSDAKIKAEQAQQLKLEQEKNAELQKQLQAKAAAKAAQVAAAKAAADALAVKQRQATLVFQTTPQCSTYQSMVAQYDWPVQTAMAIMRAESGCRAITPSNAAINYDGVPDYGLFQLHGMDVTDPAENIRLAYTVKYVGAGRSFTPWSTYNSGAYRSYLQ